MSGKFLSAFALAVGIAMPLWWRQRQLERAIATRLDRFEQEVGDGFDQRDAGYEAWAGQLTKAIEQSFKRCGAA